MVAMAVYDHMKKTEILFILKLVHSNYSFCSYCYMADLYRAAFANLEIASDVQLSPVELHYLLLFGLAPYFKPFLNDCKVGTDHTTLYFDKTTT